MSVEFLRDFGLVLFAFMAVSFILAVIIFIFVIRGLKRLDVPKNAGFVETLHYTPFMVVVFVDLLDFALDVLAVPFSWAVLDRLGLKALRNIAVFEALLPFTQVIPTMTLAWFAARIFGPRLEVLTG